MLELDNKDIRLLVDNYCKISHVITNTYHIYPVIPCGIIDGYSLIYDFKTYIPSYKTYEKYSKEKIIRNKFRISGYIINDKEEIINIVFDNNAYITLLGEDFTI